MSRADLASLGRGDRVALLTPGSSAYVEVVLGLLGRGVIPVPLDPRLTERERAVVLGAARPALVVADEAALRSLATALRPDGAWPVPLGRPMHFTSGTTGAPKGVWSGVLSAEAGAALVAEEQDLWGFGPDDVNLVLSPLHHSAPLRFAMGTLIAGGRLVVPGPFAVGTVTEAITRDRPTTAFAVPTHLHRLFAHWDTTTTPDLSCFRLLAHAGAACPEPVKRRLIELFPAGTTWEFYGATEGQFTSCPSDEWLRRPGTVGKARTGRSLRLDDDGTIWCVVPPHARFSYFEAPEKTSAAWRQTAAGPAFTVGDHGHLDADGYLYLDGRREDLIISGGVNVYPAEVEKVLQQCPGVQEVAVFGRPDEDWGQRVCAAVVGQAAEEALRDWAADRLVPAKRPKEYRWVPELPHTPTGKLRRNALR